MKIKTNYLGRAVGFVLTSFILVALLMALMKAGGLEFFYSDGVSIRAYVCSRSSFQTDGFARNSVVVALYIPLTTCRFVFEPFVIVFNFTLLVAVFYKIFLFYKLHFNFYNIFFLICSSSFVVYSSFYPSKELIVLACAVFFVTVFSKFAFFTATLMRPSFAAFFLLYSKVFANNPRLFFVVVYLVYMIVLLNFHELQILDIYVSKIYDMVDDSSEILSVSGQLYKIFVTFFGYRHFFEGMSAYNLVSIISQVFLVVSLLGFILKNDKHYRGVFVCGLLYGLAYPAPHARFLLTLTPLFIAILISKSRRLD